MSEIIEHAQRAVGAVAEGDWHLHPERHADLIGEAAGPLKRILRSQGLAETIERYGFADKAAQRAQSAYKRAASISATLSFFVVCIAALILFSGTGGDLFSIGPVNAAMLQGFCITLSLVLSVLATNFGWFEEWMEKRAEAEHHRLRLFDLVLIAKEPAHLGELPLLPLQLEYFRRFQLDVQRNYYQGRGRQHARQALLANFLRTFSLALIIIAASPIVSKSLGLDPRWIVEALPFSWGPNGNEIEQRTFMALSAIGAALQGLLAARLSMNQDQRNAARYKHMVNNLNELSLRPLDEARNAAALAREDEVLAFVALVNSQISSEHREWLNLRSISPSGSLRSLNERLPIVR